MTYTILGCDPSVGRIGVAIATHSIAAGGYCQRVMSGVGAIASQAYADPRLLPVAVELLIAGAGPEEVVRHLGDVDPDYRYRQVALITPDGRGAAHTGDAIGSRSGHVIGDGFVAAGNGLSNDLVTEAMADAFADAVLEPIEERLLCALEAGRDAGGQRGGFYERSAALVVHESENFPDIDLRVDYHPTDAVSELRGVFVRYAPYLYIYNHVRTKEPERAALLTDEEWDPVPPET